MFFSDGPVTAVVLALEQGETQMAGGYISCGDFSGEDKSGSAISGVFEALPECLAESERQTFTETVLDPLAEYLEEHEDHFLIQPDVASMLLGPVGTLYAQYGNELGHPEPFDAPQIDKQRGMNASDAKWGQGIGWRYYCLHDLQLALRKSVASGLPVLIHFD
jgi:hypothetical protein